ncbi:MAG: 3-phosphoshikimate 1-carboxyvinyltransferase [Clostridiales bacterium]|nr:3-phosphoshikimate 1-carboxyvinyltransferase [Clostridiales bacterium]
MLTKIFAGKAKGEFIAPPSKSMAHRYLICSALADGKGTIENVSHSNDILATIDCLKSIGVDVSVRRRKASIDNRGNFNTQCTLQCRESGSTLRFFIPICLALGIEATFKGSERLFARPLDVYEKICRENGIVFEKSGQELHVCGKLKPGKYVISSEVSSQFASGLLFSLPLLKEDSEIVFDGRVNSRSYIDMTISALKDFGINANWTSESSIAVSGNQKYQQRQCRIEGDYSNAAFFEAMNYLGSEITITGLREDSIQGDRVAFDFFKKMNEGYCELDISDCPDLAPVLMALGGALNGVKLTGTSRLKVKESNRGEVMKQELEKFGITCDVRDDTITVNKSQLKTPKKAIDSHNDHRIAMATATLMTVTGGEIEGSQAVDKSFPGFFEEMEKLGIGVQNF